MRRRRFALVGQVLAGALVLAAIVWLVRAGLLALVAFEERLAEPWFWLYQHVGYVIGLALLAIALLAALHLRVHGRHDQRPQGPHDAIRWWTLGERIVHWLFVLSFLVLLVSGLQLYLAGFGLPTPLTRFMRRWHVGEPFMVGGALLFVLWFRDALPRRYDLRWLAHFGGYLGHAGLLPAGRFNAGQKLWFWLEALGGIAMAVTGWELQHHFTRFDDGFLTLLAAHLGAAAVFVVVLGIHFYLAVIAVRGALGGMVHGSIGRQGALRYHPEADILHRSPAE
jgi:formate dehydrogenase subunit gamma